jgi:hypothetical protein
LKIHENQENQWEIYGKWENHLFKCDWKSDIFICLPLTGDSSTWSQLTPKNAPGFTWVLDISHPQKSNKIGLMMGLYINSDNIRYI